MGYAPTAIRQFPSSVASSAMNTVVVNDGTTHDFLDTTGIGLLHWVLFRVRAAAGSDGIMPIIEVDGVQLQPKMPYSMFNSYSFNRETRPIQLMAYAADGECIVMHHFGQGLPFNKTLKLQGGNGTGAAKVMDCFYYVSKFVT